MQEAGTKAQRIDIRYFDGVNGTVGHTLAKNVELAHSGNARSPVIGVIEKREGQTKVGTDTSGGDFVAQHNYGLFEFESTFDGLGVYRVSDSTEVDTTVSINVHDYLYPQDVYGTDEAEDAGYIFSIFVGDSLTLADSEFKGIFDRDLSQALGDQSNATFILDGQYTPANIYV